MLKMKVKINIWKVSQGAGAIIKKDKNKSVSSWLSEIIETRKKKKEHL